MGRKHHKLRSNAHHRHAHERNQFQHEQHFFGIRRPLLQPIGMQLGAEILRMAQEGIIPSSFVAHPTKMSMPVLPVALLEREAKRGALPVEKSIRLLDYLQHGRRGKYCPEDTSNPARAQIERVRLKDNRLLTLVVTSEALQAEQEGIADILGWVGLRRTAQFYRNMKHEITVAASPDLMNPFDAAVEAGRASVLEAVDAIHPLEQDVVLGGWDLYPREQMERIVA